MLKIDQMALGKALIVTESWNFDLAKEKLLESKGWSSSKIERAISDYKKYMALMKAMNGYQLVPNEEIDEVWHMHILDTRQYMQDCDELFGEYIHHYPYFGMLSEENKSQWLETQSLSENVWKQLFGKALYNSTNVGQKCPQVCPCHIEAVADNTTALKAAI
ncbi:hypothetical protein NCZ17_02355 [Acinetobacter modestus]|uniref:glycine-rich domain-containing protein n=1 Tax=Acinetobacter modestus TaxID=1776740 RepID=UPI00202FF949|nr:hypothetical protein [Acinetobacter modestus]MCM1958214.1 hypothetical protein [Acinetobacter modestus]